MQVQVQSFHGIVVVAVVIDVVYVDGSHVTFELDSCKVIGPWDGMLRPTVGV